MERLIVIALLAATCCIAQKTKFAAPDYALGAGAFASRAADWASTEECLRRPYAQCHEVELPRSLVASKPGFAAFSLGMASAQVFAQYELGRHGHRKMARLMQLMAVAATGATAENNYRLVR